MNNTSQIIKQFNIYCDESRVENTNSQKMVIGAVFIPRSKKQRIVKNIQEIIHKVNFQQEIKWVKTRYKYLKLYKSIIDYFVDESDLSYRCIIVDKSKIKYDIYHGNDNELAFFKFYYQMLKSKLNDYNQYYIFIDKKPTRDKNRARALKSFLDSFTLANKTSCNIKHLQAYSSYENILIQLSDYLTGLIGFASNLKDKKSSAKYEIYSYIKIKLKRERLCSTTYLKEDKFNVLVWKGD